MRENDDLAWHLINSLPTAERNHCIEVVGLSRGYPLEFRDVAKANLLAKPLLSDLAPPMHVAVSDADQQRGPVLAQPAMTDPANGLV